MLEKETLFSQGSSFLTRLLLYHKNPTKRICEQGYLAHWMFSKVIKLSVNQRVQGCDIRQVTFKVTLSK